MSAQTEDSEPNAKKKKQVPIKLLKAYMDPDEGEVRIQVGFNL